MNVFVSGRIGIRVLLACSRVRVGERVVHCYMRWYGSEMQFAMVANEMGSWGSRSKKVFYMTVAALWPQGQGWGALAGNNAVSPPSLLHKLEELLAGVESVVCSVSLQVCEWDTSTVRWQWLFPGILSVGMKCLMLYFPCVSLAVSALPV